MFLHEHPISATSWCELPIRKVGKLEGVESVVTDQCMFGLRTTDSQGKIQHAMKKTRFLSNSGEILRELKVKCDGSHTHQHLVGGRAGPAAVYPPALCRAICRGLVKQIHLKEARVKTLLRVDESWENHAYLRRKRTERQWKRRGMT